MGETVSVGDIDLFYEVHGSGEPVIFVHGLGADRLAWMFQVKHLRDGFQVIVFDNRDAGRSSRSQKVYDISQLANDTIALIDALEIERCHLVGASMGGSIAQQVALRASERLASLSLLCTFHSVDPAMRAATRAWAEIYRAVPREKFIRAWFPMIYSRKFQTEHPEMVEKLMQFTIDNPDAADADAIDRQTGAVLSHNSTERLKEIETPTLVMCGRVDNLTPPVVAREIAAAIPTAKLTTYPDTGHAFFIEKAEEVSADLKAFFAENAIYA